MAFDVWFVNLFGFVDLKSFVFFVVFGIWWGGCCFRVL